MIRVDNAALDIARELGELVAIDRAIEGAARWRRALPSAQQRNDDRRDRADAEEA
jgi:hypothetical protein